MESTTLRGEGAGYCIFNDLAFGRKALLNRGISRVLILDLDVHQGDGTAKIFQRMTVYTVSLHGKNNFPFRKQSSDWDIEFENGTGDMEYLRALDEVLDRLSSMEFDLFLFRRRDGLAADALGLLDLSREGLRNRNQRVFAWRKAMDLPMLIFMGGGYADPIDHTVHAFSDLFLAAAREV